jgi:hypothetical protein
MGGTLDPVTLDPLVRSGGLIQSPLGMVIVGARLPIVGANQPARHLGDGLAAAAWAGRATGRGAAPPGRAVAARVLATGKPVDGIEVSSHAGDVGGEQLWNCVKFRVDGPDGEAPGPPS